jgi:hypothetical protein
MEQVMLGLAFILEIMAFVGFSALGLLAPAPRLVQLGVCLVLFAALVLFWGRFMAPRSTHPLPLKPYYIAKLIIYGSAAYMIIKLYGQGTGAAFTIALILNELALFKYNAERIKHVKTDVPLTDKRQ